MNAKTILMYFLCTLSTNYAMNISYLLHTIIRSELCIPDKVAHITTLINYGVNVNEAMPETNLRPLELAALLPDHGPVILTLRQAGADPYIYPFCNAFYIRNVDNIKALLKEIPNQPKVIPSNIKTTNIKNPNLLHFFMAILFNMTKTAYLTNLSFIDYQSNSLSSNDTVGEITQILIDHGVDINEKIPDYQETPLEFALGIDHCPPAFITTLQKNTKSNN